MYRLTQFVMIAVILTESYSSVMHIRMVECKNVNVT